jgi:hypothetical protein
VSVAGALLFNLLANAIGSFLVAALVAAIGARAFRVGDGRWKQIFLILPLGKVAIDLAGGVPEASFFWARLGGAQQELGQFQAGVGVERVVPVIRLTLGALHAGATHPQSLAEPLATLLSRRLGQGAPGALAACVLCCGLALLAARLAGAIGALRAGEQRRRSGRLVERRRVGLRWVEVVVSDGGGVPFAGGLLRPHVCFPSETFEALTPGEREAVLRHELGHIAHHDLLLFAALGLFADLFWFVPGLRACCRAARAQAELCADQAAVAAGASPAELASALVRVSELTLTARGPLMGLTRGEPLLSRRVLTLVGAVAEPPPRLGFGRLAGRLIATAWVAAIVLRSTAFGNLSPPGTISCGNLVSRELLQR